MPMVNHFLLANSNSLCKNSVVNKNVHHPLNPMRIRLTCHLYNIKFFATIQAVHSVEVLVFARLCAFRNGGKILILVLPSYVIFY